MSRVIFHEGARSDLRLATQYFDTEARPSTAVKFVERVKAAIATIEADPTACPLIDRMHRRQRVFKFPYDIVFRVEAAKTVIVAIAHHAREPHYWQDRI